MKARILFSTFFFALAGSNSIAVPESRDQCRATQSSEEIILCIQKGLYDPCDDSGGKWGDSQCAWAHGEIADRKVISYEKIIASKLKHGKAQKEALSKFQDSQRHWRAFRDTYCDFTNIADDLEEFKGGSFFHVGYCWRRMNEQRAEELERLLEMED